MKIGIDFGTSYTAAAAIANGRLQKIRFGDGEDQFRTAVFFPHAVPNMDDFAFTPELERRADTMFRRAVAEANRSFQQMSERWKEAMKVKDDAKRVQALALAPEPRAPDLEQVRRQIQRAIRQQWLEEQTRIAGAATADATRAEFGDAAINGYMHERAGRIFQSPKSLLGFDLTPGGRATVLNVVGYILEHVRKVATEQLRKPIRGAAIGHPVRFRSSLGEAGTRQAMELVREAAAKAGYDDVTFLAEPVAASLGFHRKREDRCKTLVVDVGGGTSDFAFVELGGRRAPKVIHADGLALGGTDVDLALAQIAFMPLFGRDLNGGAPAHHYVEALSIHDQVKQRTFADHDYRNYDRLTGPVCENSKSRAIHIAPPGTSNG